MLPLAATEQRVVGWDQFRDGGVVFLLVFHWSKVSIAKNIFVVRSSLSRSFWL